MNSNAAQSRGNSRKYNIPKYYQYKINNIILNNL